MREQIKRVLVANRGEIAVRIIRACRELGIESVLACSEADKDSLGAKLADKTVVIGPWQASESYLNVDKIIRAAMENGCSAIHPGYGFLAENPALPEACERFGIIFIGPKSSTMRLLGDKTQAKQAALKFNVPMTRGSLGLTDYEEAEKFAEEIGYPVILKAAAGGGGRGMRIVQKKEDLKPAFNMATAEAKAAFGDPTLFIETYVQNARHVEVQILADNYGNVIHLGLRDCSSQRRYQKMIEEALPGHLDDQMFEDIANAAVSLCKGIGYNSAGTCEFLVDKDRKAFYFMEVNTRIQVEHPVTEEITGVDLINEMIELAYGKELTLKQSDIHFKGHAIECRVTAEDSRHGFIPGPGLITTFAMPNGTDVRVDTHCFDGFTITPFYDSLIGKVIVRGETRKDAIENMKKALTGFVIKGVKTNIDFLLFLLNEPEFVGDDISINWIEKAILPKFNAANK